MTISTGTAPILLTPGPLTTSDATRQAMLTDWGSWDADFKALTARVLARLLAIANAGEDYVCVPIQGSGTSAVEATIGTLVPRGGKLAVLVNGAYGRRSVEMCRYLGRAVVPLVTAEDRQVDLGALEAALASDPGISHVAAVYCETTSGILNPVAEIAAIVHRHGRRLILDAVSAFGALPLDLRSLPASAVVLSSNKCIEGVPGAGFVLVHRHELEAAAGQSHSLTLDLHAQWAYMAKTGQWRFTPPTHVMAAFDAALRQHAEEGGTAARGARYAGNCRTLVEGMRAQGFATLLADAVQAPIIVTFLAPADPRFAFGRFYDLLKARGFIIYPGKMTEVETFRIGVIGHIGQPEMRALLRALAEALAELGVELPHAA